MGQTTITVDSVNTEDITAPETTTFILPKKAINFIANYAEGDFTVSTADEEKSLRFNWGNVECTVQTLKGQYPDLTQVKASVKDNNTEVEFNLNELRTALKRHQVSSAEIEFIIKDQQCTLTQSTEVGSGAENIYCVNNSDESITLCMLIDYLLKVITSMEQETIKFQLDLEPQEGETIPTNNVLVESDSSFYCLSQLVIDN